MERATAHYQESIQIATTYLHDRGLSDETIRAARLGVVDSPEPGHEFVSGRLAIPYVDKLGVYGIKFRCLAPHDCKAEGCAKYIGLPGQETSIYNVLDVDSECDTIHVTEGELDCLALKQVFPEHPVVGIPGVTQWKPHAPFHFHGFERVLLWMDGDPAGASLGDKIRRALDIAEVVPVPSGLDVTDLYVSVGAEVMRSMIGLDEEGD